MWPKWFDDWNTKNPTNIYGPAILVGALGAAVFGAIALVTLGQPFKTDSMQTGPRGTGMSVPEFVAQVTKADPTIEGYLARGDIADADKAAIDSGRAVSVMVQQPSLIKRPVAEHDGKILVGFKQAEWEAAL